MSKKNLLDGKPKVQLSLDLQTMADALPTAEIAVRAGVDWLEVGTPLILGEGLHAVAQLHQKYPNHPIIADLKTMDAGYLEAEMMYRNGASFVVVMGQAHEHTIREAVRAAREFDRYVMGDIMLCPDKVAMAKKMEQMGVDVIIHHTGLDERHWEKGKSPLDELKMIRDAVKIPLQAVGGLSIDQAAQCPKLGAQLVVIGAPLAVADYQLKPGADSDKLFETISNFVKKVKGL
ncbi:MAG TPA: orotidine 5'-phosphate decarboxylase / HUMPS family protein [Planctomycetota bacterium]|nr:orotidine 5'-phosphate decarboxylase / HUMPS family protein [Planctomycetota bacterium]